MSGYLKVMFSKTDEKKWKSEEVVLLLKEDR